MAKKQEQPNDLEAVYNQILGEGDPVTDDDTADGGGTGGSPDEAYLPEDYDDDTNDGVDPRDKSTGKKTAEPEDEAKEVDEDELPYDAAEKPDDDDEEVIPEHLVAAGRRARLDDETIIELAETRPEILEALARTQEQARRALEQTDESPVRKKDAGKPEDDDLKPISEDDLGFDEEEFDGLSQNAQKAIKTLMAQVNKLTSAVKEQSQGITGIQQQAQRESVRRIDRFFDDSAKDVPLLGKSENLTKESAEARMFAHRVARGAQLAWGDTLSDEDALAIGVSALKGKMTESQIKAKLVGELSRNKKRFTARPRGSRQPDDRAPKKTEERAMAEIDRILDDPSYKGL